MKKFILSSVAVLVLLSGGLADAATVNHARATLSETAVLNVGDTETVRCPTGQETVKFVTGPAIVACNRKPPPTTTTIPVTTTIPTHGIWQPAENTPWMWEISNPLVTTNASLMGTGVTAWNGDTSPADNPQLIDIDGIDNSAATVAQVHALGERAVCYIETGAAGNYYSASAEGIPVTYYAQLSAAGDFGNKLPSYPEYFIKTNASSTVSIIESMIKQQCAAKGFDGVETDLDTAWSGSDGTTGFNISQAQGEAYDETIANYIHSLGMAWIAKNLDEVGSASFVSAMEPYAQGMISEECNAEDTCSYLSSFLVAHLWIGNAEYTQDGTTLAKFCASDNNADMNGILFSDNLSGGRQPCR